MYHFFAAILNWACGERDNDQSLIKSAILIGASDQTHLLLGDFKHFLYTKLQKRY